MADFAEVSPPDVWIYENVDEVTMTNPPDSFEYEDEDGRKFGTSWGPGSSLTAGQLKLDVTMVLNKSLDDDDVSEIVELQEKMQPPLFCLASINQRTAPCVEISWDQLLALSCSPRNEPPVLTVGRHQSCSVQLQDPRVSLRHFEIVAQKSYAEDAEESEMDDVMYTCVLNDLSSNGTAINGTIVGKGESAQLHSGDEICVLPASVVGEDQKIGFLFRNAAEAMSSAAHSGGAVSSADVAEELGLTDLVSCPICMMVIHRCVALTPCLHNFCSACLSDWMNRGISGWTCALCQTDAEAVVRNHAMDEVVAAVLRSSPENCRSESELADMDARDRLQLGGQCGSGPGLQTLRLRPVPVNNPNESAVAVRQAPTSRNRNIRTSCAVQ